ncbi:MAG: cytochrome ubiquinol oxidase subunit I, partial [Deltaproteobacteria bacterium]|nr:cytochrome ubiquinol oxidase subunit I [Deltaproteobacteria bacterium]
WDRIDKTRHLALGWLYFIFAWLSLFLINGIIGFMLTPGSWLQTRDFWDGFFNPTFWPSLVFRTGLALMLAGVFGFITASFIKDDKTRQSLLRYAAWWASLPLVIVLACGWWYVHALPPDQKAMVLAKSREIQPFFTAFLYLGPVVALFGLLMAIRIPRTMQKVLPFLLLIPAFGLIGSFEYVREAARRPYLIHDHMYSNGILQSDARKLNQDGYLKTAKWIINKDLNDRNRLAAGRELFFHQCSVCHSISGALKDIKPRTAKFTTFGMDAFLNGVGKINEYMPPFLGTRAEREALAAYIVSELQGKPETEKTAAQSPSLSVEVPPFDSKTDEYVLLAWNNLGMHCISDVYKYWVLQPPANDLHAQLIKRGDPPQMMDKDAVLTYKVQPEFEKPAERSLFWKYADKLFGKQPPPNIGLSGLGLNGEMKFSKEHGWFEATMIPVEPYPREGGFNPYPLFRIEAKDGKTGQILASTLVVAPTSTEMGCHNCHGGQWRVAGVAGIPDEAGR